MENKIYTYLKEFVLRYPEKALTVTDEELHAFITEEKAVFVDMPHSDQRCKELV